MAIESLLRFSDVLGQLAENPSREFDATDSSLHVASVFWFPGFDPDIVVSDTEADEWVPLPVETVGVVSVQLWYCIPTAPGPGRRIMVAADHFVYAGIGVSVLKGTHPTDPYVGSSAGSSGTATTRQVGPLDPGEDGCVLVTGLCNDLATTFAPYTDGLFVASSKGYTNPINMGGGIATSIQTTATSESPTWAWGGENVESAAVLAAFRPAGGGGAGEQPTTRRWGGVPHLGTQKLRGGHRGGPWGYRRQEAA